jgi:translation initiation factor 1
MARGRVVYSSGSGRVCPTCGHPADACACSRERGAATRADGIVRVRRETKGRRGKTVTVVTGIPLDGDELNDLAKRLKRRCGSGGSVKQGAVEIQGDHVDTLVAVLDEHGFTVKRAGG